MEICGGNWLDTHRRLNVVLDSGGFHIGSSAARMSKVFHET